MITDNNAEAMACAGVDESERQPCEVWTRVMGYHRPITEWNKGKQAEYSARTTFTEAKAMRHVEEASRMVE